jgi:hypothetical protein
MALIANELTVWTQRTCLTGQPPSPSPNACATPSCTSPRASPAARRRRLLQDDWPGAAALLASFPGLDKLPAYG